MTPRDRIITFRPDDDLFDAMERLKERDGIPFSQMIRRGLRTWLESKGVLKKKSRRPRVSSRKRR